MRTLGPYLVKIAFDQNVDDSKPINVRLRAMRCLFSVTGKDVLEQVIGSTIEKLRYVFVSNQFNPTKTNVVEALYFRLQGFYE